MRDERPSSPQVVSSINATHRINCQAGGVSTITRTNIRIGAKNGTIDVQNANPEFGCCRTGVLSTMAKMMGSMADHCTCCASWSEFTMEPSAAYIVEYRK